MESQRAKRKADNELESWPSAKRAKVGNTTDVNIPHRSPVKIVKEGILQKYDESKNVWTDASVKLYSNADFEWKLLPYSSMPSNSNNQLPVRVRVKPTTQLNDIGANSFSLTDDFWIDGTTNIPRLLFMAKTPKPQTAAAGSIDPFIVTDQERWMHLINYTALQHTLKLKSHNHPLTLCCKFPENTETRPDLIGPSVLNAADHLFACDGCGQDTRYGEVWHCEFCDFNICPTCSECLSLKLFQHVAYSVNHRAHQLVKFFGTSDITWFPRSYRIAGLYICSICKQPKKGFVYHCVECGNYDECFECFKQQADVVHETNSVNEKTEVDPHLDIGLLSHLFSKSGNDYEMTPQANTCSPRAASMISTRCWDVSKIDAEAVPHAYFEVTIAHLSGSHVSVGVANQLLVQNQLLGYQQNSVGYCCNGQVTQNIGSNTELLPRFGAGDTIGVGMLLDSFNMRRLYFTKNGQFLGYFSSQVHVGMDCFPGVSVTTTTCQSVKVSVNMTGPFKFDVSSIPDYRPHRQNFFEQLPAELIVKCLSCVGTPQQVVKFFYISKRFMPLASDNEIWKQLFLLKWPLQNSKLKLKSWMTLYERRYETEKQFKAEEQISRAQKHSRSYTRPRRYPCGITFIENVKQKTAATNSNAPSLQRT